MRNLLKRTFLSVLSALLFLQLWGCSTKEFAETFSRIENSIKEEIGSEYRGAEDTQAVWEDADIEKKPEEETKVSLAENFGVNYAYSTLDEETRIVYDEVLDAILSHEEEVSVSTVDTKILENAYKAVCADYGGLFWVSGYVYTQYTRGGKLVGMDFTPKYTMSHEERIGIQEQIDDSVEELLAGISVSNSDYEKAKYVFEILIQNVDYDASMENNQNIISVFLSRATVCQGYACATQYLLNKLGVPSTIVTGMAEGESHAWNLVRLDGNYYYMDTTWGNSRYLDDSSQIEKYVNYSYLAVTSEEISRTHVLDSSFPLPECTSMENNYFVREGKYFTEWNPENVGSLFAQAWSQGGGGMSVKFSSPELYQQAIQYFIADQHIADYCEKISSIYYLEDPEQYVLTINFV
ncbi:transglutaminase domain-containing protein [Lachnospiraceae bacterium 38-14]